MVRNIYSHLPQALKMKKRKYHNTQIDLIQFPFLEQESFISIWFLSYCLLVSESEKFIVRQVSPQMKSIESARLIADLKLCVFQETQHAQSHKFFNDKYLVNRPLISLYLALSKFVNFSLLETITPTPFRLSAASAMEQLNAEISYFGLRQLHSISSDHSFQNLLGWHFVEEIEHRDCVYDLIKETNVSRLYVLLGALLTLFSFSFWITAGAFLISLRHPRLLLQLPTLFSSDGILLRLVQSTVRYLKHNYHPSDEILPPNLSLWQQKLQGLE
jgi:predicted metal-dependent hydrolase